MNDKDALEIITENITQICTCLTVSGLAPQGWRDRLPHAVIRLHELHGGSLNKVYRVQLLLYDNGDGHPAEECSLIYKHAPPYFKVDPSLPLPTARTGFEFSAMQAYHRLIPGCVPVPIHYDEHRRTIFMEDLRGWAVLKHELLQGRVDIEAITSFMGCLATIHNKTSSSTEGWINLSGTFVNNVMASVMAGYVFKLYLLDNKDIPERRDNPHHPLFFHEVDDLRSDRGCLHRVEELNDMFLQCNDCLCHGDLHTESIMIKNGQFKIIDTECTCMGPSWYDTGMFIANMILALIRHHTLGNAQVMELVKEAIVAGVKRYMSVYTGVTMATMDEYITNTCGMIGTEVIRRVLGATHFNNPHLISLPAAGEVKALMIGRTFLCTTSSDGPILVDRIVKILQDNGM